MQEVQLNGNEFLIVSANYPHPKLTISRTFSLVASEGENSPTMLWMLEEGIGTNHGFFYIKNVKYQDYRLTMLRVLDWHFTFVFNGPHTVNQLWRLEKVTDNLGDEWDYYRIRNKHYKANNGTSDTQPTSLWRLVPRYLVKDGGYIQIKRHSG